jgi:hypothetical protein
MGRALYDDIGDRYTRSRKADPVIAAMVLEALDTARYVVSVGAGTGSYEPASRKVVGIEPSSVMILQRPR